MIHLKAIAAGLIVMTIVLAVTWLVAKYPVIGLSFLVIFAAYCLGRGALEVLSTKRS